METEEKLRGTVYGLENAGGAELSVSEVTFLVTGSSGLRLSSECLPFVMEKPLLATSFMGY